jgi:hypothetical protein
MTTLTSKLIYITQPSTPPALPVQFVKPLSYEFRVAEFIDNKNTVIKVGLQVQVMEHDEYGAGIVKQYWKDVERVQVPYVANLG